MTASTIVYRLLALKAVCTIPPTFVLVAIVACFTQARRTIIVDIRVRLLTHHREHDTAKPAVRILCGRDAGGRIDQRAKRHEFFTISGYCEVKLALM